MKLSPGAKTTSGPLYVTTTWSSAWLVVTEKADALSVGRPTMTSDATEVMCPPSAWTVSLKVSPARITLTEVPFSF